MQQSISQEWFEDWARYCQDGGVLTPGLWFASQSNLLAVMPAPKKDPSQMLTSDRAEQVEATVMELASKKLAAAEAFRCHWLAHPCYGDIQTDLYGHETTDTRASVLRRRMSQRLVQLQTGQRPRLFDCPPVPESTYYDLLGCARLFVDAKIGSVLFKTQPLDEIRRAGRCGKYEKRVSGWLA